MGSRVSASNGVEMGLKLPDCAREHWIMDDGILRQGYILPDGQVFKFNEVGHSVKVAGNVHRRPTYNVVAIILGLIVAIAGLSLMNTDRLLSWVLLLTGSAIIAIMYKSHF